ncbi:MAG: hypothetical protein HC834_01400 [Rhodospirillales bacterium]|nr:hypothetical protein [Rhodospirillales bacterium]
MTVLILGLGLAAKAALLGGPLLTSAPVRVVVPIAHAKEPSRENDGPDKTQGDVGVSAAKGNSDAAEADSVAAGGGARNRDCGSTPGLIDGSAKPYSEAEVAVLQQLAQRRDDLTAREGTIRQRETILEATETRIDEKISRMKDMQKKLEGLIRQHGSEQDEKLKSLVKIYESMKPRDAARIFETLGMDTLLPVVERMNARKLAPIMASLGPEKAKDVTIELKRLREMSPPSTGNQ